MDWQSLKLDEKLFHFLLPLSALFAFVAFYLTSSCKTMVGIYCFGVVITIFISVPDWPYFYRNPLSWHRPLGIESPIPLQARSRPQTYPKTAIAPELRSS